MRAARRAGSHPATSAADVRIDAATRNTVGSVGDRPNNMLRVTPAAMNAPAVPSPTPHASIRPTSRITRRVIANRLAPSAIRTPSSFVRRAT
jgi:hypothetical protein